jgi:peptide deformylase
MKRVSVIDVGRIKKKIETSNNGPIVLINATLIQGEGIQIPREGCLSVPDLLANVRRFQNVIVQTEISQGEFRTIKAHGLEALALQHELDHLQGKLFLDRVSNLKTDIFRRKNY